MSDHVVASMNTKALVAPSGVVPSALVLTEFWADRRSWLLPNP